MPGTLHGTNESATRTKPGEKGLVLMHGEKDEGAEGSGGQREDCDPGGKDEEEGHQRGPERSNSGGKKENDPREEQCNTGQTEISNERRAWAVFHGERREELTSAELARSAHC